MAWKSAPYTGTHQERKLASKAVRGNERRAALAEAMIDYPLPASIPDLSENRPVRSCRASKPFGLRLVMPGWSPDRHLEWTTWYATERARNDALVAANKDATSAIMPVIAIGKCER
jgi:hypothetical protein